MKIHFFLHVCCRKIEQVIRRSPFFFRIPLAALLFVFYILSALLYSVSIIFFSPQHSFRLLYQLNPEVGYTHSYVHHLAWQRHIRVGAALTTMAAVIVSIAVGSLYSAPQPAYAATCTISSSTTIDQTYIDTNNCSAINISTSGTNITWSGTTDLVGDGTVTITSGVVVFVTAATFGSTDDLVVNTGATLAGSAQSAVGLQVTAQDMTVTGSVTSGSQGCFGGSLTNNGQGPDTTTGVCAASTSGYGKGETSGGGSGGSYGGAGGRGSSAFAGTTYGSQTQPTFLGSGGGAGNNSAGGKAGGYVRFDLSGTLTIDGTIRANGAAGGVTDPSYGGGGGSGGSVYLTTQTVTGTGTVSAIGGTGGDGSTADGGGGGGGRIAIYYLTDSSGIVSGLSASTAVAGGAKGGAGQGGAENGATGTLYTEQYTAPATPSISSPTANATGQARAVIMSSSTYSNSASHTSSDWQVSDNNTFSDSDCSDANIVFCSLASTSNKTSITASSTHGTFQNGLSGKTELSPNTTYYVRVRYKNIAGDSSWSVASAFTTIANVSPSTPSISAPTDQSTGVSKNPTITASAFSDANGDAHTTSDWALYAGSDCSGTTVWLATSSAQLTGVTVNASNGTFASVLQASTTLWAHTTYSAQVRYTDSFSGSSNYSSCVSFTTTNTAPVFSGALPDYTINEDAAAAILFDLDDYVFDADENDNDQYTCTAATALDPALGTVTVASDRSVVLTPAINAYGTGTVQFSCADGASAATTDTLTISVENVNDVPGFTIGADRTVDEDAGAQTVSGWATDIFAGPENESEQQLTFTVDMDRADLFDIPPAVHPTTGDLTFTTAANAHGVVTLTVTVTDAADEQVGGPITSAAQSALLTITPVDDPGPTFVGTLPNVSFMAGTQTTTIFDLDDYIDDVDQGEITYAASGHRNAIITIDNGAVMMTASQDVSGNELITFTASADGTTITSNAIAVIMTEYTDAGAQTSATTLSDISHVTGAWKKTGRITVVGKNSAVLSSWDSFSKGGVVPRIGILNGSAYVFAVKRQDTSKVRLYSLEGTIIKKFVTVKVGWKRLTTGILDTNDSSYEIVVASRKKNRVYLKVYSYNQKNNSVTLVKLAQYGPVKKKGFQITLRKKTVYIINKKGKTILKWKPFDS